MLLTVLWPFAAKGSTAIVNNNGGTGQAEDSLCVTFFVTDTIGNFTIADSFYVMIFSPWGDSVYAAAYAGSAAEIKTAVVGGRRFYRWMEDVADIDGSSPRSGTYAGVILAVDTLDGSSSARLDQAFTFSFVLEPTLSERVKIGDTCSNGKPMALVDDAITSAKIAANAVGASEIAADAIGSAEINIDAWLDCWSSSSRTLTTDSFVIDLSSFDAALDNDTTLVGFLRAGIGGGGSSDSTSIARWVWNTPQGNHVGAGTFGKYLDAQVSGLGAGSGAYSYSLVYADSSKGEVIPGVNVAVRNLDQSALLAVGQTDTQGKAEFNLNAAGYTVIATATGYLFEPFDTVVIVGAGADTLYGYQFDPGTPMSPWLCRVYGHLYTVSGTTEEGAIVSAMLPSGVARSGNRVVSPFAVTAASDTGGYFAIDLIPSDSLTPSGTKYEFSITRKDGTILRQRVRVPAQASWRLDW